MRVTKNIVLLIGFLLSAAVSGQSVNEVFKKMNTQFTAAKPLQFSTKYNLYKDHKTKVVQQSYNGNFFKNASNEVYMKIDNTEFINTKKLSLKVSHGEKAMVISDKQEFSTGDFDVSKLMVFCKITSFKDFKNYWEIILVPKQLSGLNYSKIVLNISKSFLMQKQIFYYNTGFNFSKDYQKQDLSYPRLEIIYSNYNSNVVNSAKMNTNSFFVINKNNKVSAAEKYKNYEVSDRRTNIQNKNKPTN